MSPEPIMEVEAAVPCPEAISMSDECNFCPASGEARESGDGDSGPESKENPEEGATIDSEPSPDCKRPKKASRIPVRQARTKPSGESTILEAPELFRAAEGRLDRDHDNTHTPETGDTNGRALEHGDDGHGSHFSDTYTAGPMAVSGVPEDGVEPRDAGGAGPSIVAGVAECARASGCSRVPTAEVRVALIPASSSAPATPPDREPPTHLSWSFRNGRLVFENAAQSASADGVALDAEEGTSDTDEVDNVLSSKDLNRRIDDSRSRLKHLEQKLKDAGITDTIEQVDRSPSPLGEDDALPVSEIIPEGSDLCEFDARQVSQFPRDSNGACWEVYDELSEESDSSSDNIATMGIDGERQTKQHNPDRDNLKSLLKRPGGKQAREKRSNRVVFNENKNEFFDADYIILIREECDYDDEDDDGVCTCNQHEMVRLTCCEPNCNCSVYEGYEQTPQSPKFAPPLEFVDAVTLSPPEGYKDMELEEQQLLALQQMARRGQQQRTAVCRECSVTHEEEEPEQEDEGSQSDNEVCGEPRPDHQEPEEKEKTDQSQQTTPTTPPSEADSPNSQRYILETISMTTVTEQRVLREVEEERKVVNGPSGGSPINGILKGGRLWKQQSMDVNTAKVAEPQPVVDTSVPSDDESSGRRSVRFTESDDDKRDSCDGASDHPPEDDKSDNKAKADSCPNSTSPESTEMTLTFKLGNHVLISNNSLKPNSAVRQLFPCTKPLNGKPDDDPESIHQYLVTAESLRAFEEAKRSKLPQIIQSGETDDSIKRAIERNTLRRSLIRYEPRAKKNTQKTDNSLVERIKQLTCDVDDNNQDEANSRVSPPGEESRNSPDVNPAKNTDKSFSPSSSSTASSNSSSMSSTYKKITDLFGKRDKITDLQNSISETKLVPSLPDLGNGGHLHDLADHCGKINHMNDSRKQFLSTLAPLTSCVGGVVTGADEYYYQMGNHIGDRTSVASSIGTEYSLEDIDEGLKNTEEEGKKIAPDVLAGTPSASESGDELAMFVQQDASRMERIKKKYQPEPVKDEEDDEHDDYGFNRRPSVRGIKPRFGSTTEILQQIQNQLQPPAQTARVAWPYYSESGLTGVDNSKTRNLNQNLPNYQYPPVPEDLKGRNLAPQYRPTSLQDENLYQNCSNQRCVREVYRANGNQTYATVMKEGVGCTESYYQSLPRPRNGRPQSPPPLEMSKTYHQTMVYIPYNHIEGYQPTYYQQSSDYVRVTNQNQINKRYIEPIYQQRIHPGHEFGPPIPMKPMVRMPQAHLMGRSESPLPGQFSTARSTQTPMVPVASCNYYAGPRYRPIVGPAWPNEANYVTKPARHSFPALRYPTADSGSLTDSDSQLSNGYRQTVDITFTTQKDMPSSPTKPRYLERGVAEGAASSVQDSQSSSSTMTSPTSPQNPPHTNQKPLFYAMNV